MNAYKHNSRKLISVLLAVVMAFGTLAVLPFTATAFDDNAYYLVGYIDGADYGCEADYENMGDYGFSSDGTVTATFA
ncbi:MAG: hypothetical protein LUF33_07640 [Clostridiales bacterium]|nr:hypothetical protein [Clostridiales bacterium]